MNHNEYCLIMAGGVGSRFWPMSTSKKPKQFHDILNHGKTLIQHTFDRLKKSIPIENIYVITQKEYEKETLESLPELSPSRIIIEPLAMNTAPCILYSLLKIHQTNPDACVTITPADHLIEDEQEFSKIIKLAMQEAQQDDVLITLGIKPNRPDTGYGYIQYVNSSSSDLKKVKTFTEKPDINLAENFLLSGDFLWNAGIFIGKASVFLKAFEKYMPEMFMLFTEHKEVYNTPKENGYINEIYPQTKKQSIDYGVMEKADNVHVLPASFGWSDLGTWDSVYDIKKKDQNKNVIEGKNIYTYKVEGSYIKSTQKKAIVISGLKDYLVIDTPNALLICPKEDSQKIKDFVNDFRLKDGSDFQ